MKITLLTAASHEYWPLLQLTAPNKLQYCLKHHIQLDVKKHTTFIASDRQWMMLKSLDHSDWLWFMGADTLVMNHNIDVRQFLDDKYDFIIGEDINGINNDVFFLKNNDISNQFLYRVIELNKIEANDQESMKVAMREMPEFKVKIVHQKQFNSYLYSEYNYPNDNGGSYSKGDFVLHLPGIPNSRRIEIVKEYLKLVDK